MESMPKLEHAMIRVTNLEKSIRFYTHVFGLTLLKKTDYIEGEFTLAFLGSNEFQHSMMIELTYNWNESEYHKGNAFGHFAFAVCDIYAFFQNIKQLGVTIIRPPAPMKYDDSEVIAFIEDPDGYSIEIVERR